MTTYPLSEAATIYATDDDNDAAPRRLSGGTLVGCAAFAEGLSGDDRSSALIKLDDLDLSYGPAEITELLEFLRSENEGLSNKDIASIADKIE